MRFTRLRFLRHALAISRKKPTVLQAPVVQTLDSAIHRINHYPADSVIGFPNTYPLDSAIQRLNNWGQESTRTCTDYLNRHKKENNATPRLFWFKCVLCFYSKTETGDGKRERRLAREKKDPFSFSRFSSPSIPSPFLGLSSRLFV